MHQDLDEMILQIDCQLDCEDRLNVAFHVLHYGEADLYAINKARYLNEKNVNGVMVQQNGDGDDEQKKAASENINNLATGMFVTGLEYSTGKESIVIGKPSPHFFAAGLEKIGCSVENTVMVGDDWKDDVRGAMQCGMRAILCKTGKYRAGDEDKALPTATVQNIDKAVEWVLDYNDSLIK